jgi:ferredoxin
MMRVVIDEGLCTGHGELDSSSVVEAQIAVDSCPEQAIAIIED